MSQVFRDTLPKRPMRLPFVASRNISSEKWNYINQYEFLPDLEYTQYAGNILGLIVFYVSSYHIDGKTTINLDSRFTSAKNASKAAAKQAALNLYFATQK